MAIPLYMDVQVPYAITSVAPARSWCANGAGGRCKRVCRFWPPWSGLWIRPSVRHARCRPTRWG